MSTIAHEKGSSLVICLMVLCLLTLLGTAALVMSTTESKITHHLRKFEQAFCAADSGAEIVRSIPKPGEVKPGDVITSMDLGTIRYEVTPLDNLDLGWGIYILNIESEGRSHAGTAKRSVRIDVQRVDHTSGTVPDGTDLNDYDHGSESAQKPEGTGGDTEGDDSGDVTEEKV